MVKIDTAVPNGAPSWSTCFSACLSILILLKAILGVHSDVVFATLQYLDISRFV